MNKTIDKLDAPTDFSLVLGGPLYHFFASVAYKAHFDGKWILLDSKNANRNYGR